MVWQGPRLGFVAESRLGFVSETGIYVPIDALSKIPCFWALLPTFRMFSYPIPVCLSSWCSFVWAPVTCYSQQLWSVQHNISNDVCSHNLQNKKITLIQRYS